MNKKQRKEFLSAVALVLIFAAWLILQRTGLLGGSSAPLLESSEVLLELPAQKPSDNIVRYQGFVSSYNYLCWRIYGHQPQEWRLHPWVNLIMILVSISWRYKSHFE